MARASTFPPLPNNIPDHNPLSPPYAGNVLDYDNIVTVPPGIIITFVDLNDFDNTVIRITFDPDEIQPNDDRAAPIRIFDDPINEASEQVFVVQLHLINSTDSGSVFLTTRQSSLCRIIDNDRKL